MKRRDFLKSLGMGGAAVTVTILGAAGARAEDYPTKPVTFVIPFNPGGPVDVQGRYVGDELGKMFNRPFVSDYRPGGSQLVAVTYVTAAKPDGYTLFVTTSDIAAVALFNKAFTVDVAEALDPVAKFASTPVLLIVPSSLNVNTLAEFVEYAKNREGGVNYAATGTTDVLVGGMFKDIAGFEQAIVRYGGGAPAATALAQGEVQYALLALSPVKPFLESGAVKVLAVLSPERFPALPDVPTTSEAGFPSLTLDWWYGLVAPAGTPHEIRSLVGDAIVTIMSEPKAAEALAPLGILPAPMATDAFGDLIKGDIERWTKFANEQGIVPS